LFLQDNQLNHVKTKLYNLGITNKLELNGDNEYTLYFDSVPVSYIKNELERLSFKVEYSTQSSNGQGGGGPCWFFLKKYKRSITFDTVAYYIRLLSFIMMTISITLYCLYFFFEILLIGCINKKFACRLVL
jgi:hypothetical protein